MIHIKPELINEVRSDALDIKVFYKNCGQNDNCQISEKKGSLVAELNKKILSKAAVYQKETKDKMELLFYKCFNTIVTRCFGWGLPKTSLIPFADCINHHKSSPLSCNQKNHLATHRHWLSPYHQL